MKTAQIKAFSLVEALAMIAVLAILATGVVHIASNFQSSIGERKLASDAETINRAVASYLGSGGNLDAVTTPNEVLARLRSKAASDVSNRLPGLSSSLVDPRVAARMQTGDEATKSTSRAYWDAGARRFVVTDSGAPGVKEFFLDETLTEDPAETEARGSALLYAENSTWVWDFQETANPGPRDGPSDFGVGPDTGNPPVLPPPTPADPPLPPGPLDPPVFSVPGGEHSILLYSLEVALSNPNPSGSSRIVFATNYGPWQDYTGPLTVGPETVVSAQSLPLTKGWSDSAKRDQSYEVSPYTLEKPLIAASAGKFGLFSKVEILVSLTNPNPPGVSTVRYRIAGGGWRNYGVPFVLAKTDFLSGVLIEAEAISSGSPYYLSSGPASRFLGSDNLDLSGNTSGSFSNPVGSAKMVTNLASGESGNDFRWGIENGVKGAQSAMRFVGNTFASVADGERFKVGTLTYYNGTIRSGTGADTVDLKIIMPLEFNETAYNPDFDFSFELINTVNNADLWASADFVRLADSRASRTIVFDGYEFEFRLEFGETTANGFSRFDEFHVLEDASASVTVYGTFVPLGTVKASP